MLLLWCKICSHINFWQSTFLCCQGNIIVLLTSIRDTDLQVNYSLLFVQTQSGPVTSWQTLIMTLWALIPTLRSVFPNLLFHNSLKCQRLIYHYQLVSNYCIRIWTVVENTSFLLRLLQQLCALGEITKKDNLGTW